jgi:hypothetical protein
VLAEPANDLGAHAAHALDLGLHGRGGHYTGEYLRVNGGRGCVPSLHCIGRMAVPSGGVLSMRAPPGSREWTSRSGLVIRTFSTTRTASRGGSAPPAS